MKKIIIICSLLLIGLFFIIFSLDKEYKVELQPTNNDQLISYYIDNELSSTYPNNSNYDGYVMCYDSNKNYVQTDYTITWDNNKWTTTISNIPGKVKCDIKFIPSSKLPSNWLTSTSGDLLYAIRNDHTVSREPLTTPGSEISLSTEKALASTQDDYGYSLYYRGNITNNYVLFAGKCWRIVRISGDGSIKLFLWNDGNSCTSSSSAYTGIPFNPTTQLDENDDTVYNYATGVGFMYGHSIPTGETDNEKYLDAQSNTTDSYILKKLKDWYDLTFNDQALQNKLADTIWCGDKSRTTGVGYGQTKSYFGALSRLYSQHIPSLICPAAGTDGKLSKYTASDTTYGNGALNGYKIGLITADEVAFAGGVYNVANASYYLRTGATYWTMSPWAFSDTDVVARVFRVYVAGTLSIYDVTDTYRVYPVVSLTYDTTILSGDGSASSPYQIS